MIKSKSIFTHDCTIKWRHMCMKQPLHNAHSVYKYRFYTLSVQRPQDLNERSSHTVQQVLNWCSHMCDTHLNFLVYGFCVCCLPRNHQCLLSSQEPFRGPSFPYFHHISNIPLKYVQPMYPNSLICRLNTWGHKMIFCQCSSKFKVNFQLWF